MKRIFLRTTRRSLMAGAAAATALSIVPRHVLGQGQTPPSEKITLAGIGVGGMGSGDMQGLSRAGCQAVALCDVDTRRSADSVERFPDARRFKDFREMLEAVDKQIDAVLVATPDHVHAVAAAAAIKRKKHVYCEKPLAHSVWEVRQLMKLAGEHGVVTQLGNQGHSFDTIRLLKEWIEDGAIGAVEKVHAGCRSSNSRIEEIPQLAQKHDVPPELDWDLWLGPVQYRPYNPMYLPARWRSWRAFGTGTIGDWTCHVIDPVFWALDLGGPESVELEKAEGWDPKEHSETFPKGSILRFDFPAKGKRGPVRLLWHDGQEPIPRPEVLEEDRKPVDTGAIVYGEKGVIMHGSHGAGSVRIIPETKMREYKLPEKRIPRAPRNNHHQDFVDAIKEKRKSGSDFSYGGPLTELALIGAIAQLFPGQKLHWDSANMRFSNSADATKLLTPKFREGWSL